MINEQILELNYLTRLDATPKTLAKRLMSDRGNSNNIITGALKIDLNYILSLYLAHKIYMGQQLKNGIIYDPIFIEKENEFTVGLWNIFCLNTIGEIIPELSIIPNNFDEYNNIIENNSRYINFYLYNVVKDAIAHCVLVGSKECRSMREFDLHCRLPGVPGYTAMQHCARKSDKRKQRPARLLQAAIGMYKYDVMGVPEPMTNFWKENALQATYLGIYYTHKNIMTRLRYAMIYDLALKYRPSDKEIYDYLNN